TPAAEVAHQLLALARLERRKADLLQRRRQRGAENAQSCGLRQSPQLPAERAEQAERLLALPEQTVQQRQRPGGVALANQVEDLERVLGAVVPDQPVNILGADAGRLADVNGELGDLLRQQSHVGTDEVHEELSRGNEQLLPVLAAGPLPAPLGELLASQRLAGDCRLSVEQF